MNWIAILVLWGAVINDCSARNNKALESIIKKPCDNEMPNETFNITRLLSKNKEKTPMFIALRELRESIKKLPALETGFNMKNFAKKFKTVKNSDIRKAFQLFNETQYAERGLKEIQILLYKFYVKLDKILNITEDKLEKDTEVGVGANMLALLCVFVKTGINPTDGVVKKHAKRQQNVKTGDINIHRDTFKLELSRFLRGFKNNLSMLVKKAEKNRKKNGKQNRKKNGKKTRRNKKRKQNKCRRRQGNKRTNKKRQNCKNSQKRRSNRRNSRNRDGILLRKKKDDKSE